MKNLKSSLAVKDFLNLEKINCFSNHLIKLSIVNCPNVFELNCSYNLLTNLDFLSELNTEKLTVLDISINNFSQSLEIFSKFRGNKNNE